MFPASTSRTTAASLAATFMNSSAPAHMVSDATSSAASTAQQISNDETNSSATAHAVSDATSSAAPTAEQISNDGSFAAYAVSNATNSTAKQTSNDGTWDVQVAVFIDPREGGYCVQICKLDFVTNRMLSKFR